MASDDNDDAPWTQQLLMGLGALAVISLVIGGIVSVVVLGAAKISGISSSASSPTARASLYIPPLASITGEATPAGPNVRKSPSTSSSPSATATTKKPKPKPKSKAITLQAFPNDVASGKRIHFSGVYALEGARLQVQRLEGRWVDFPATTSVQGGIFQTFIYSGHAGLNRFRVYDAAMDKASNVVRVTIH
jgi:hypothetical protein